MSAPYLVCIALGSAVLYYSYDRNSTNPSRTNVFFQVATASLAGELVTGPLTAALMALNPWVPILVGQALLGLGVVASVFMPETLSLRRKADTLDAEHDSLAASNDGRESEAEGDSKKSALRQTLATMRDDAARIWHFMTHNPSVMLLLVSFNLEIIVKYARMEILLQYTHRRYNWTWAEVLPSNLSTPFSLLMPHCWLNTVLMYP